MACLLLDLVDISGRNGRRLGVDVTMGSRIDRRSLVRRPDRGPSAGPGRSLVDGSVVVGGCRAMLVSSGPVFLLFLLQVDLEVGQAAGMVLRVAMLSDLSALVEVQRSGAVLALGEVFPQDTYPFPTEGIRARWVAELADPQIEAYVIVDGEGTVAGFAATRGAELLHFGTAVETWGTGLAAQALAEIVDRLVAAGVRVARLRVFEENGRARRFYEKQGWVATWRRSRTSFPPHPVLVEYERRLRAG